MIYREVLLAPRQSPKLEDQPSSAVRECLFNLYAATLLIGGRSSIRNTRTLHAVVKATHYMGAGDGLYLYVVEPLRTILLLFGNRLRWFNFNLLKASEKKDIVRSKVILLTESERQLCERVRGESTVQLSV
jgi:hypothetical protein